MVNNLYDMMVLEQLLFTLVRMELIKRVYPMWGESDGTAWRGVDVDGAEVWVQEYSDE